MLVAPNSALALGALGSDAVNVPMAEIIAPNVKCSLEKAANISLIGTEPLWC